MILDIKSLELKPIDKALMLGNDKVTCNFKKFLLELQKKWKFKLAR